jgi:glyceraldehyde-3-phosphate dehydrogenase/erythrose-4-phosphate dehydrogenase
MWNVKTEVIPVIIGATGTISKSPTHYLGNLLGKHEIKELQKVAIFGAAHILRRVTDVKVQNMSCSTNCKYRTAAILYAAETRFGSGI